VQEVGNFATILPKIGCHGNVPWDIEKRGPDRSSAPETLSFDLQIAKIRPADLEIICLWEIIKKIKEEKKKEITEGKIYSPVGRFAKWANKQIPMAAFFYSRLD